MAGWRSVNGAARVPAITGEFYGFSRVLTILAAVLRTFANLAIARGVVTFFGLFMHGHSLSIGIPASAGGIY